MEEVEQTKIAQTMCGQMSSSLPLQMFAKSFMYTNHVKKFFFKVTKGKKRVRRVL